MPSLQSKHADPGELQGLLQMNNLILDVKRQLNTIRVVLVGMNSDFNRSIMRRLYRLQWRLNKLAQQTEKEHEFIRNRIQRELRTSLEFIRRTCLTIDNNLRDIELSIAFNLNRIQAYMLRIENLQRECEETKRRICLLEIITSPKCYPMEKGVFSFCTTNFRTQRDYNECIALPFTTSRYGYKFLLSVYPNGYGAGSGTHLSVTIAIMSGTFDALLPWPFCHSFTIRLINQLRNGDCIEGDLRALTFNRPSTYLNQPLGFDHFIDLTLLFDKTRGFLVNDTLIFHVSVDTTYLADACKMFDVENGCKNLHTVVAQATN